MSATGRGRKADKEPGTRRVGKGNKGSKPSRTKRDKHRRDPTK